MTDEQIIAAIEWHTNIAPYARRGPKWGIAATLAPLKPGDVSVGEAVNFKYAASRAYVAAATRKLQRQIIARYRRYNEAAPEADTQDERKRALLEAAAFT